MRALKEGILNVFSMILGALCVIAILISMDIIHLDVIRTSTFWMQENSLTIICVSTILLLLAIIGLFTRSETEEEMKTGLAIKRENGTIYIARSTFESIATNVVRSYASLRNVKVNIIIDETGTVANIMADIMPDTVVPEVTLKLQEDVKDSILRQTTVDVKQINVKIRGVYNQVEKKS